ncbi:hypothetical protein ACJIZ3_017689 [Penstemon smallii]|uniref:Uncharacterized protein n=1 Tax=Penstemon smallii TaxID=265156 RepID=A0ABD3SW98_9LAMI
MIECLLPRVHYLWKLNAYFMWTEKVNKIMWKSRAVIGDFGQKGIECAHFPRSLLGSSYQPIDLSDDEDALILTPISMYGDDADSEAAAPPIEEVNPLAIVPYEGPSHGADDNVNGGGDLTEPQVWVFFI